MNTGTGSPEKVAARLARRIQQDVLLLGWPVGHRLGSEEDLLHRYQASRVVLREALHLTGHLQITRMQPGPRGGCFVTAPSIAPVVAASCVLMSASRTFVDSLFEARDAVEGHALILADRRATEKQLLTLRQSGATPLPLGVARLAGNPVVETFVELLLGVTSRYLPYPRDDGQLPNPTHELANALLAGDLGVAQQALEARRDAEYRSIVTHGGAEASIDLSSCRGGRPTAIAQCLLEEIRRDGWPVGQHIGSEPELRARFKASSSVLREAVGLLEHLGVATTRRGPNGGLFVTYPGSDVVSRALAPVVEFRQPRGEAMHEADFGLELLAVKLAAKNATADELARVRSLVTHEDAVRPERPNRSGINFHIAVAEICGNHLVSMLIRSLVRAMLDRQSDWPELAETPVEAGQESAHAAHQSILEAIESGDALVAQHRMRRHLETLESSRRRVARAAAQLH